MADVAKALAEAGTQGATQFGPFGRLALDPRKLSDVAAVLFGMAKAPLDAAQNIQQNYRPGAENEIVNQDIGRQAFDAGSIALAGAPMVEKGAVGSMGGKPPRLDWDTPLPTRVDVYHGSTADVSGGIKPMARAKGQVPAISLATTEEQAAPFTYGINGKPTAGSSITKGQLDPSGFREVDWPSFAGAENWSPRHWQRLLTELQDSGTPGALVRGMSDAGGAAPQYVVLDPSRFQLPGAKLPRVPNPIKAYHGSPHDFDKFDASKRLTGEGANAYGPGLYFAEHPEVAQTYKNTLAAEESGKVFRNGERIVDPDQYYGATALKRHGGDFDAAIGEMERHASNYRPGWFDKGMPEHAARLDRSIQWLRDLKASGSQLGWGKETPGHTYEVNLHATPEQFVDWDKPLSAQPRQAEVRRLAEQAYPDAIKAAGSIEPVLQSSSVSGFMSQLGMENAANSLREAGIPGIRYKDQLSRGAEGGTSNYVVFPGNEHLIEIIKKYGIAGLLAGGAALPNSGGGEQ